MLQAAANGKALKNDDATSLKEAFDNFLRERAKEAARLRWGERAREDARITRTNITLYLCELTGPQLKAYQGANHIF